MRKYQQLFYKSLERRPGFIVKVVPVVIGCPEDGTKQLGEDIRDFSNEKKILKIVGNYKIMSYGKVNS